MVGCVIVFNKKIIAEGFTSPYGNNHAEVNAINNVKDKSLLKQATLYVTLEPCSHFGKTPPCSDLIIKYAIPKVIIGCKDDNEKVAGKGIAKLRAAGCKVTVGVLEQECKYHHKRFFTFHLQKRPIVILKWAESQDRFLAPISKQKQDLDGLVSKALVVIYSLTLFFLAAVGVALYKASIQMIHEKWNGKGYPKGLKGESIPLSARIVAVADVCDALRSKRPYKEPWPHLKAVDQILREKGEHFDPEIITAFVSQVDKFHMISKAEGGVNPQNCNPTSNSTDGLARAMGETK